MSTKTAPFGTQDTPLTRIRIIGGKSVRVPEEANFGSPYGSPRTGQFGVAKGPHQIIPHHQAKQGVPQLQPQDINQSQAQQAYNPLFLQQQQHFKQLQQQHFKQLQQQESHQLQQQIQQQQQQEEPWQQQQLLEQQWQQRQNLQMHQIAQAPRQNNTEYNSNRFSRSQEWNSHQVLPPIGSKNTSSDQKVSLNEQATGDKAPQTQVPNYQHTGPSFPTENPIEKLLNRLPKDSYLPTVPVTFSKEEELYLRRLIIQGLKEFNSKKLKDLYMDLTGNDKHLTGYVEYHDLSLLLSKYQAYISTQQLRLIASMFVDAKYRGMANYEKVLSFIDSSLKERDFAGSMTNRSDGSQTNRSISVNDVSPITHAPVGKINTKESPFSNHVEDTKLFRLIQQQLLDGDSEINFETVWQEFSQADRLHRSTLSKDQIKALSTKCRIPLQGSILDQIIERCDSNHGQYNWRQYLEFLEKIYPTKTGLKIPESKKPTEYAKHYPKPSSDWPNVPLKLEEMDLVNPVQSPRGSTPQNQREVLTGRIDKIQDGRAGVLPEDIGKANAQPAGIPNGLTKVESNQQRERRITDLETHLQKLETEHEMARTKALEQQRAQRQREHSIPWIDRFLKLGQALYASDPANTGYLNYYETKWLAHEYNRSWRLDINEADIDAAIKWSLEGEKVILDAFLKRLVKMEPK